MGDTEKAYKRKGPDRMVMGINIAVLVSWVLIILIGVLILMPSTSSSYLAYRQREGIDEARTLWSYAFYLMVLQFVITTVGIIINRFRHRRKTDTYHRSLFFFAALSLAGIIYYLMAM